MKRKVGVNHDCTDAFNDSLNMLLNWVVLLLQKESRCLLLNLFLSKIYFGNGWIKFSKVNMKNSYLYIVLFLKKSNQVLENT